MKIAIPYKGNLVSQHYGQSEGFKVYTIENKAIVSETDLKTNGGHGCELSDRLKDEGISLVIAGGMGTHAVENLRNAGIGVLAGTNGTLDEVLDAYLKGTLVTNEHAVHVSRHNHVHSGGACCGGHH